MASTLASGHPWVDASDPIAVLPKVSLHDHLDGSIRPETLVEIAIEQGEADRLPSRDPVAVEAWLQGRGDLPRPSDHTELFALLCSVMQTPETIRRVAAEYVATAAADGVVYAESRWAPEKHLLRGMGLDDAVVAVAAGLDDGMARAAADGRPIIVRQLLCGMRDTRRTVEIAHLALRHRHLGVVGYDLAGVEPGFAAASHREAYDICHDANLPTTLHAGEGEGVGSVWEAVQRCHAQRIGHGTRLVEDLSIGGHPLTAATAVAAWHDAGRDPSMVEVGPLAAYIRDRRIPLEQCPTSNSRWVVPSFEAHPVDLFRRLGFTVTVNPDNRLLAGASVSSELRRLVEVFGWSDHDILEVTLAGLDAAFIDVATRRQLRDDVVLPAFA